MSTHHGPKTSSGETGNLILSVPPRGRDREPLRLPVRINSLSATGALLEIPDRDAPPAFFSLSGREAVITVPSASSPVRDIEGRISWTRPAAQGFIVAFELKEPELEVRRVLEEHLGSFPRDLKELWDAWDEVHHRRPAQVAEQAAYLVGVGAVAAGTTLYLAGPDTLKLYGCILALYGCLMMAAKSLWSLWRGRAASRS